jgi:hypothetical protein
LMPQAPRDRRERHHRPQIRGRDGARVQHQPANRVTDRRSAPDGQPIAHRDTKIGTGEGARNANLEKAALESCPKNLEEG